VLLPYTNESGLVPADTQSLRTKYENVFAVRKKSNSFLKNNSNSCQIGDCNWIMLPTTPPKLHPKAGGFAEGQARIAIRNIFSGRTWHELALYHQDASCKTACAIEITTTDQVLASIDLHSKPKEPLFEISDIDPEYKVRWTKERREKHFK
jgi:hypothetical protein